MQEWKHTIGQRKTDIYEDRLSVQIQMRNERISDPANMRFKFEWSTNLNDCGIDCRDPRNEWEEVIEQIVWINTGMYLWS